MKPILNLDEVAFDDVEENGIYTSSRYSFEEMDEVDLAFWLRTTPEQRLRTMWSLVEDSLALKGHSGPAPLTAREAQGPMSP